MSKLDVLQQLVANDLRQFRERFFPAMKEDFNTGADAAEGKPDHGKRLWRVSSLETFQDWHISGIVGGRRPSHYSESPRLWNLYFRGLGVKGVFFAFDLQEERKLLPFLRAFFAVPCALDLTVTDPFKQAVFRAMGRLSTPIERSRAVDRLGIVNHLIFDGRRGRLFALNTDGPGMVRAMESRVEVADKRVVIIGAGGSACSIAYELVVRGCSLRILNRTRDRVRVLAESLRRFCARGQTVRWGGLDNIAEVLPEAQIVVNAVSEGCPVTIADALTLQAGSLLADTKYGGKAELAEAAQAVGLAYVDGRAMLFGQFEEAAEQVHSILAVPRPRHLSSLREVRGAAG